MSEKFTEFGLSTDSYAAFDATSLKSLIKKRLTDKNIFTDHIFEGSNISSVIDIIAYSYHTLLFYLNRTSSESMFTEAQLYENINRIVKLLNYNPTGYKTSVLSIEAKGTMTKGSYTIPRYSFVDVGGIKYSTSSDISFGKLTDSTTSPETIHNIGDNHLLHQGSFEEYPVQIATGEGFETLILAIDTKIKIDAYNIYVYVESEQGWSEYTQAESLFLEAPGTATFELRLNENKMYEIRFGNDVYGKRLLTGDRIAVYYLKSDGEKGEIGANSLDGQLSPLTTKRFLTIRDSVKSANTKYMSINDLQKLTITNSNPSTSPEDEESVQSIKTYAPKFFGMQNRLISSKDFEIYINKQYGNFILDSRVVSNNEYIDGHMSYMVNTLGLQRPVAESRALHNQVNFANSTNFNNVYIYAVPKFVKESTASPMVNFLAPAQRSMIINGIDSIKAVSSEPVIVDPVYMAIDLCAANPSETLTPDMRLKTYMNIVRRKESQRDADSIKEEVVDIIKSFFGSSSSLGYLLDINLMYSKIAAIADVTDIYMSRSDNTAVSVQGITLLSWHPAYDTADISILSQNTQYPFYKMPYLFDSSNILSRIKVVTDVAYTS
jgi:hypothetical protein